MPCCSSPSAATVASAYAAAPPAAIPSSAAAAATSAALSAAAAMSSSARSTPIIAKRTGSASRRGSGGLGPTNLQAGIHWTVQMRIRQSSRHGTPTRLQCKRRYRSAKPAIQPATPCATAPAEVEEGAAGRQKGGHRSNQEMLSSLFCSILSISRVPLARSTLSFWTCKGRAGCQWAGLRGIGQVGAKALDSTCARALHKAAVAGWRQAARNDLHRPAASTFDLGFWVSGLQGSIRHSIAKRRPHSAMAQKRHWQSCSAAQLLSCQPALALLGRAARLPPSDPLQAPAVRQAS